MTVLELCFRAEAQRFFASYKGWRMRNGRLEKRFVTDQLEAGGNCSSSARLSCPCSRVLRFDDESTPQD